METDELMTARRSWWRQPAVRRLVASDLASLIGDYMVLTAIPFAVIGIGGGGVQIGVVLAAQAAALAVFLPFGGVLGDRVTRRGLMVAADLIRLGSQAAIASLVIAGVASFWQLVVAQLIHGAATGIFMPASQAIVPDVVSSDDDVQPANSAKQVARSIAGLGGPAIGGLLVAASGAGFALAADGATFAASAFALTGLPSKEPDRGDAPQFLGRATGLGISERVARGIAELRRGCAEFWACAWLRTVVLQFTVINALVVAPFYVFGPILSGPGTWAAILTALAAGELAGGFLAFTWRPAQPLLAGLAIFLLWGAPLLALATSEPVPVILGAAALGGVAQAVFSVLWVTTMQTQVPADRLARLTSFDQFGGLVMVPLGFAIGGAAQGAIGASAGLVIGAVVLVAATVAALAFPSVRHLQAAPVGSGAAILSPTGDQEIVIARAAANRAQSRRALAPSPGTEPLPRR